MDHAALAHAVVTRRNELGLSQQAVSTASRRIDTDVNLGGPHRKAGFGTTTILSIEQGDDVERREHTLHLLDQVLRWPFGTAHAVLYEKERPDGDPADGPCPCVPERAINGHRTVSDLERTASADEVALLRREVLHLASVVDELADKVSKALN